VESGSEWGLTIWEGVIWIFEGSPRDEMVEGGWTDPLCTKSQPRKRIKGSIGNMVEPLRSSQV
jgi:hypothetical protein